MSCGKCKIWSWSESMTEKCLMVSDLFSFAACCVFKPSCCVGLLLPLLLFLSSSFLWVSSCLPPASCSALICSTCDPACVFCLCQIIERFHPSVFCLASPECWHLLFYLFYSQRHSSQCFICLSLQFAPNLGLRVLPDDPETVWNRNLIINFLKKSTGSKCKNRIYSCFSNGDSVLTLKLIWWMGEGKGGQLGLFSTGKRRSRQKRVHDWWIKQCKWMC